MGSWEELTERCYRKPSCHDIFMMGMLLSGIGIMVSLD